MEPQRTAYHAAALGFAVAGTALFVITFLLDGFIATTYNLTISDAGVRRALVAVIIQILISFFVAATVLFTLSWRASRL